MHLSNSSANADAVLVVISDEIKYVAQYKALRASIRNRAPSLTIYTAVYGNIDKVKDPKDLNEITINLNSFPEWDRDTYPSSYATGAYLAALRPKIINYILQNTAVNKLLMIGADMYFYKDINKVFNNLLNDGNYLAVTPHMYTPPPKDGKFPNLRMVQLTGHLNADFILIKNSILVQKFFTWMAEELETNCVSDYHNGVFFDQVYLGFCYTFLPNLVHTVKDPFINMAYYNLHERELNKVNLICFQFSGFNGIGLSKYLQRKEQLTMPVVKLAMEYEEELRKYGYEGGGI